MDPNPGGASIESKADLAGAAEFRQVESLFHAAMEQGEDARENWLDGQTGFAPTVRDEVKALLQARCLMTGPAVAEESSANSGNADPLGVLAGKRVGNYRLVRLLGQGGMGVVYLARRDDGQFEQEVAVKLMGAHLGSEFFTARFLRERQILADLNHPNITRLLDGGVSEDPATNGLPYLVMEYVDGEPIDRYCDSRRLPIVERIRLFLEACAAVEYAHHHQIVHRDLKPANILVTAEGVSKLLDFGTARLQSVDQQQSTITRFTMMTPRYASPEQLRGEPATEVSDVCSLGIILYELVTGAWPFGDAHSPVKALERATGSAAPLDPSVAITGHAPETRSATPRQLAKAISGSLSHILLKAIETRPEDRYQSVRELAADLDRYLAGQPVSARRASRPARQKKTPLLMIAAAALLVVAAVGYGVWNRWAAGPPSRSVAVLPFANPGGDAGNQYLIDGLTEDVTDELSRNRLLFVIDHASVRQFRDAHQDARDIGRRLNVAAVLEGEVQRTGTSIKVTARLERTSDRTVLWHKTYERPARDLSAFETELAADVSAGLGASQGSAVPASHVVKDEAFDLTQRASFEVQQYTPAAYDHAEEYLHRAIEIDPSYARAYHLLGLVYHNRGNVRGNAVRTPEERRLSDEAFQHALALQPDYRAPRAMLALHELQYDWDWVRAERELRRALAEGPDMNAEGTYSYLLLYQRRFAESARHRRTAEELSPADRTNMVDSIVYWFQAGEFEKSLELEHRWGSGITYGIATLDLITVGRGDEALKVLDAQDPQKPWVRFAKSWVLAQAGRRAEALSQIHADEARHETGHLANQWFALTYAYLGDTATAVKWLNLAADAHEWQVLNIAVHPAYRTMQDDPGFRALKHRIGVE